MVPKLHASNAIKLNTFAHSIFVFFIYMQWWHKPVEIENSTTIRGNAARELLTWMSMYHPMNKLGIGTGYELESQRIRTVNSDPFAQFVSRSRPFYREHRQLVRETVLNMQQRSKGQIALADCDELLNTGLCFYYGKPGLGSKVMLSVNLKPMDVERWKCAANLFIENPPSGIWTEYEDALVTHTSDWPPLFDKASRSGLRTWLPLTISGCIYGGLHVLPWTDDFPTIKDKRLWQSSVLLVLALGPLILLYSLLKAALAYLEEKQEEKALSSERWSLKRYSKHLNRLRYLSYVAMTPVCLAYCFARAFLVVESVIALFHSTSDLYKTPNWPNYLLHIN